MRLCQERTTQFRVWGLPTAKAMFFLTGLWAIPRKLSSTGTGDCGVCIKRTGAIDLLSSAQQKLFTRVLRQRIRSNATEPILTPASQLSLKNEQAACMMCFCPRNCPSYANVRSPKHRSFQAAQKLRSRAFPLTDAEDNREALLCIRPSLGR